MAKTGVSLFIALSLVIMIIPLLPLCILFVRKVYHPAILNVLKLLCLFVFLRQLISTFILPGNPYLPNAAQLAEFILTLYLFKLMIGHKKAGEMISLFLVSFLSVVVTIYALKGITAFPRTITTIQGMLAVAVAIAVMAQLISNQQIILVTEPVFWIAGGCLCYYGMIAFMELLTAGSSSQVQEQKALVLFIVELARFGLFAIAAYVTPVK